MAVVIVGLAAAGLRAEGPVPVPKAEDLAKAEALREDMRRMIDLARDRVFPALVNISVVTVDYYGGKEHKGASTGSGTIISSEGYVLTNQHVTDKGKKFSCRLADKQEISAKLIGEDPLTDLAVLKLNLNELKDPAMALPVASFGNSDELRTGDHVMAMGSPLALSRSVTLGIVSNTERVFTSGRGNDVDDMELDSGQRTGLFTRWIQHDAMIQPGNSGGPLVNLKGEIIGVNELGGNAMGFAIPSNLARGVADALVKFGEVPRSWIGVSFKPIEKTGFTQGVLVNSVTKGGPADKAGVQAGDLILRIAGEAVTTRFAEEVPPLMKRIADLPIGSDLKMSVDRKGSLSELTLKTEKLQKDKGEEAALRAWGMSVEEITDRMVREYRFDDATGAYVASLNAGGPAQLAEPPISEGDVIKSIDGQPIADLAALVARYKAIMGSEPLPEYLLVEFDRNGKNHVTLLKPKPPEDEDPPREVPKAWIGIATQPVLEKLAVKLGTADARGFRVTRVYPRTAAAASGELKVGDIITGLNGQKLVVRGMQDAGLFSRLVRKLTIDEETTLDLIRGGEKKQVKVKLERTRIQPAEARRDRNRDFEMSVREVTFFDRDDNRWDESVKGVLVESVEGAGWAGLAGIRSGDLIQKIGETPIKGIKGYRKAMEAISKAQPERVVFEVLRGSDTRFQYAEPDWKPIIDAKKEQDAKAGDASKSESKPAEEKK